MGYAIEVGDIISINYDGRIDSQQDLLTTHYQVQAITPDPTIQASDLWPELRDLLDTVGQPGDYYRDCLSEDMVSITYVFQKIFPTRYVREVWAMTPNDGAVAESALPPNVAHVVTLRSDLPGPAFRGNKHIGGVPNTFSLNGEPTPVAKVALNALGASLITTLSVTAAGQTVDLIPVIYRRATPILSPLVTNYVIGDTTRVERRRTVRLGS